MCGITGFLDWRGLNGSSNKIIQSMTQTILHRGPDGEGKWCGSHVAFGHTRLSIIDIRGGTQPMVIKGKNHKDLAITFNGEVFNYKEIQDSLKKHGHIFKTNSDTEVILRAYDQWGQNCVKKFTGMFGFAIWDDAKQQLFMARDPLGVKPLYYYPTKHGLIFGTEEKAILAHPDAKAQLDSDGLNELFSIVPMTNPNGSLLLGITQIKPGHTVVVSRGKITKKCYWQLEALPHTDDEPTTVKKLRVLFEDSVRSQLVSDVPLGAMLSGGVDSSAVAAFAAKIQQKNGKKLPTFAIDYQTKNASYSASHLHVDRDTPWAEKVAKHIKSNHSTHYVSTKDLLDAQQDTLYAWGRPSYSPVNVSLYLLFKHIRESGVRTVLGGEGADEAFAGYRWWRDTDTVNHDGWPWHTTYKRADYLLNDDLKQKINPDYYLQQSYSLAVSQVPKLKGESAHQKRMREISWLTYTYYLNFLLHRVDRTSMAAGVEARVPFCDHNFVQYAWNIPWDMKNTGNIEKGILRKAIDHLVPKSVAWRKKSGYPVAQMAEYQQALWSEMRQILNEPNAPVWQIASRKSVAKLLKDQEDNIGEWTGLNHISYILEMNTWLKQFKVKLV